MSQGLASISFYRPYRSLEPINTITRIRCAVIGSLGIYDGHASQSVCDMQNQYTKVFVWYLYTDREKSPILRIMCLSMVAYSLSVVCVYAIFL